MNMDVEFDSSTGTIRCRLDRSKNELVRLLSESLVSEILSPQGNPVGTFLLLRYSSQLNAMPLTWKEGKIKRDSRSYVEATINHYAYDTLVDQRSVELPYGRHHLLALSVAGDNRCSI